MIYGRYIPRLYAADEISISSDGSVSGNLLNAAPPFLQSRANNVNYRDNRRRRIITRDLRLIVKNVAPARSPAANDLLAGGIKRIRWIQMRTGYPANSLLIF